MSDLEQTVEKNFAWAVIFTLVGLLLGTGGFLLYSTQQSFLDMKKNIASFCDEDGTVLVMDVVVSPHEERVLQRPRCVVIVENNKGQRACWPFLMPTSFVLPDPGGRYRPNLKPRYNHPLLIELERVIPLENPPSSQREI